VERRETMEPKSDFTVKEFLWRQAYPLDPAAGMTLFATVLEDEAGRRLFVYADPERKPEAFEADGKAIAVEMTPFPTKPPYAQGHLVQIRGAARSTAAAPMMAATAGARTCTKLIGGIPMQVCCPPYGC
jgi:hypothetical protein